MLGNLVTFMFGKYCLQLRWCVVPICLLIIIRARVMEIVMWSQKPKLVLVFFGLQVLTRVHKYAKQRQTRSRVHLNLIFCNFVICCIIKTVLQD